MAVVYFLCSQYVYGLFFMGPLQENNFFIDFKNYGHSKVNHSGWLGHHLY